MRQILMGMTAVGVLMLNGCTGSSATPVSNTPGVQTGAAGRMYHCERKVCQEQ